MDHAAAYALLVFIGILYTIGKYCEIRNCLLKYCSLCKYLVRLWEFIIDDADADGGGGVYNLGSFAYLRACSEPKMPPLFTWKHFATDKLFAFWVREREI